MYPQQGGRDMIISLLRSCHLGRFLQRRSPLLSESSGGSFLFLDNVYTCCSTLATICGRVTA